MIQFSAIKGQQKDTLESWFSKFSRLTNLSISPDKRWLAVKKIHYSATNNDTVLLIDTHNRKSDVQKFTAFARPTFLNSAGILGKDRMNRLTYINFRSNKKLVYKNVHMAFVLSGSERYALLNSSSMMTVYNKKGDPVFSISGIESPYATDKNNRLFACKRINGISALYDLSGTEPKMIHSTSGKIQDLLLMPSGRFLFIIEENRALVYDGKEEKLLITGLPAIKDVRYDITEISEAGTYLIEAVSTEPINKNAIVDIWYGNDPDLKNRNRKISKRYWIWQATGRSLKEITNHTFPEFSAIDSERYLFAYHPTAGHNYVHWLPQYKIYSYDFLLETYRYLGNFMGKESGSPDIYIAPDRTGTFIASEDSKKWTLFNQYSNKRTMINKDGLRKPMFSSDAGSILFESGKDIWRYDIARDIISPLGISDDKKVRILNYTEKTTQENKYFYLRTVNLDRPLLCEISDSIAGTTEIVEWSSPKKIKPYVFTENRLDKEVADARNKNKIYVLEENSNMSPAVVGYDNTGGKELIYGQDNKEDKIGKKKIICYKNKADKKLRGILYYPVNFLESKKYPMIVHIYQVQSNSANRYLMPEYEYYGFNIRTLLKRGYFVFMPDIVYDERGTGVSALDCVNSSLDALLNFPNIEFKKIGLIGHSHGGYETNFIATHSDRFAAYISGSGNSDIVRSYFSYNYNFDSPFYWQFENGQYEMKAPFSENKNLYLSNNPILNVEKVNAPILLWAGKKDENIAWDQVMEFYIGLRRNSKPVIAVFYPGQGHGMSFKTEEIKDLTRRNLEWWDYFLKSRTEVPWIRRQMKELF
ncbi:alpha/beta hydrolase family protein [Chryseobacterium sp. G0240]|uniref:alpha/beta hydrolase family protein n=1 Tax=Chryseobacterium sp. G0240 TaxID=2487066 RepID=UPI00161C662C|nr:prolyl oligopeptidase family serine peptidase [Chryseobacterium sp. G0240]